MVQSTGIVYFRGQQSIISLNTGFVLKTVAALLFSSDLVELFYTFINKKIQQNTTKIKKLAKKAF